MTDNVHAFAPPAAAPALSEELVKGLPKMVTAAKRLGIYVQNDTWWFPTSESERFGIKLEGDTIWFIPADGPRRKVRSWVDGKAELTPQGWQGMTEHVSGSAMLAFAIMGLFGKEMPTG